MPVMVILGEGDHLIPAEMGRKLASACRRGEFVGIPSAGHMAPMENPEAVNAAMARFLAGF
jgi:pimeloyl-ACP methyl ester carboxylesterase